MSLGSPIVTDKSIGNRDGEQASYNNAAGVSVKMLKPLRVKMNSAKRGSEVDKPAQSSKCTPNAYGEQNDGPPGYE